MALDIQTLLKDLRRGKSGKKAKAANAMKDLGKSTVVVVVDLNEQLSNGISYQP